MRKDVKRLLSILVAVVLVLSAIPAATAADGDETIVYAVDGSVQGVNSETPSLTITGKQNVDLGKLTMLTYDSSTLHIKYKASSNNYYIQNNKFFNTSGTWIGFKFHVDRPLSGMISFDMSIPGNASLNAYIVRYVDYVNYDPSTFDRISVDPIATFNAANRTTPVGWDFPAAGDYLLLLQCEDTLENGHFQFYSFTMKHHQHEFSTYEYDDNATYTADGTETSYCDTTGCTGMHTRVKAGTRLVSPKPVYMKVNGQDLFFDSLYSFVAEAAANNYTGTVYLTQNAQENAVAVPAGITLDLLGQTLTTNALAARGTVIDSVGTAVLKAKRGSVTLLEQSGCLPIWDGAKGGYIFQSDFNLKKAVYEDGVFIFRPELSGAAQQLLVDGAADNGVMMRVQVSYKNTDGTIRTMNFDYADELVKQVYSQNKAFTLVIGNAASFAEMTFTVMIASETQIVVSRTPIVVSR